MPVATIMESLDSTYTAIIYKTNLAIIIYNERYSYWIGKYLTGSTLVWYSSKQGMIHMGWWHWLHIKLVVFRPWPLFLLHTTHTFCPLLPDGVQGRWLGKCRSVSRACGGSGRWSLPWHADISSATFTEAWRSSSLASSMRNCSWVNFLPVCSDE